MADRLVKTTGTTSASSGTNVFGAQIDGVVDYTFCRVVGELVGATGDTLDVYLQCTPDGTHWFDYLHFPQRAAGAGSIAYHAFMSPTTNSATTATTIGSDLTPALAANTNLGGPWGQSLRWVVVSGASTSAGAALTLWTYFSDRMWVVV